MYDRPLNVEAALLYETRYSPIVFAKLLARINARVAELGMVFNPTKAAGERFAMFTHPDMYILISLNTDRLAPAGFADALNSPFIQAQNVDYAGLVGRHTSNIFITVGDGPIHKTTELRAFEEKLGGAEEVKPANLVTKIKVLHRAMLEVFQMARPTLVHWCQSNNLFLPELIDGTAHADFPTPLVTHHGLFSSGKDAQGNRFLGSVVNGSELFLDKPIVLQETAEPFNKAAAVIDCLLDQFIRGENRLPDGATIPVAGAYQVRLQHKPAGEGFPNGQIAASITPIAAAPAPDDPLATVRKADTTAAHPAAAASDPSNLFTAEGRPQSLDVALLYGPASRQKQRPFEIDKFVQTMNILGAARGISFTPGNIEDGFVLCTPPGGADLHITIQMADRPLAGERLARARDLNHQKLDKSELRDAVETHMGHFLVRVVTGALPLTDSVQGNDFLTRIGMNSETAEEFETRLLLARGAAEFIATNSTVDALYWGQSDKLADPGFALMAGHAAFPLNLYTQPRFSGAGKDADGKLRVGFRLDGSEHLLGRLVLFAPSSLGTKRNLALATDIVAHCYRENILPQDGQTIGYDDNQATATLVEPGEKYPFGAIRLTRVNKPDGSPDIVVNGEQKPRSDFPATMAEAAMNVAPPSADGTPQKGRAETRSELAALYDRVDAQMGAKPETQTVETPGWGKLEGKLSGMFGGAKPDDAEALAARKPAASQKLLTYALTALVLLKSLPIGLLLVVYHVRSGLNLKIAVAALLFAIALPMLQKSLPTGPSLIAATSPTPVTALSD